MKKKIKIIIAEDHPVMRIGYASLINDYDDLSLIGQAENGKILLDLLELKQPDVLLLDLEMPIMSGTDAFKIIKERFSYIKVIVVTMHDEKEFILDFLKRGVNGYIVKGTDPEILIEAIYTVYKDGYYLGKNCSDVLLNGDSKKDVNKLLEFSERQLEIITMIAVGRSNKQIADQLFITLKTVDYHKHKIYQKTKTFNSASLTDYAHKSGLL